MRRKAFEDLFKQRNDQKVSFLIGARQVGKTTLLKQLYGEICTKQKHQGIFLDLDVFTNFEKVSSFENLVNLIKLNGYDEKQKGFFYLFLDEFQRYGDLSIIIKNLYDNLPNVKVYASGSSSIMIKDKIQESLAGRKKVNVIYPLDFEEFLHFKGRDDLVKQITNLHKLSGDNLSGTTQELSKLLNEFLVFGGYPEVALKKSSEEKKDVLRGIFDLYIKKDLVEYLNIKKVLNVKKLIEYLAINNGQKTKYEDLGAVASMDHTEVKNYIEILSETYIISVVRPYFTNKNKELTKIPKVYFIDNGVRNFFINNFNPVNLREDSGFLFEGYAISELIKCGLDNESIKFWQDKNKHEVDIILDLPVDKIPIEIKFKNTLKPIDRLGIDFFFGEYLKTKNAFLINLNVQKKEEKLAFILPYGFAERFNKR
jgi:uncharacterized protein